MIDEIAGGLLKVLVRGLIEVIFEIVCYLIGYPVVKIFTLGKFPKSPKKSSASSDMVVCFVGLFTIVGFFVWLFIL